MDIIEAFKPFLNKDGSLDQEKFKAAFNEYAAKNTIQPVQDNSQQSIDRYKETTAIDLDAEDKTTDILYRRNKGTSDIGAQRYKQDLDSYVGAKLPILAVATGEADKTRGNQMDMFNALLADKKEAREFNARLTPGKVVDMVTRLGATAGLLFR